MRGESHLGMNMAVGGVTAATCYWVTHADNPPEIIDKCVSAVMDFMLDSGGMTLILFVPLCIVLYLIGALLPDIDTPYSMMGRIFCLPFEHRTWTHAIWLPVGLCIGGIWVRPLFWLGLGVFFHDFFDSFSAAGLNWFYPIESKKKKTKRMPLYYVGKKSEYMVVSISWILMFIYIFFIVQSLYHIVNIEF